LAGVVPENGVVFLASGEQFSRQVVEIGGVLILYAILELFDGEGGWVQGGGFEDGEGERVRRGRRGGGARRGC
jgi:hypothetical protein